MIAMLFSCVNSASKVDVEWHALIENSSLKQWNLIGEDVWELDRNLISASPQEATAYLQSVNNYENFHLKFEFWIDDNTNSGVFFRCAEPSEIDPINCYEANIWDTHPDQAFRTGSLVTKVEPLLQVDTINKWNSYEIVASGSDITVTVNGKVTAILPNARAVSGPVALQYAGKGIVKFRNIYIKQI